MSSELALSPVLKYKLCHIDTLLTGMGSGGTKENERCYRDARRIPSRSSGPGPRVFLVGIRDQIRWEASFQFCPDRHLPLATAPDLGNNLRKGEIRR